MEANEAQELQEQAENAEHAKSLRPVAFTMSLLAVLVAVTTVVGHRTHTEAVLNQAKKNRAYDTDLATKLLDDLTVSDKDAAKKDAKEWAGHQAKWADDLEKEKKVAEGFEEEVKLAEHKADYFDFGEALLEIGLVISSVTLLTRSRIYWYFGIVASTIGVASAVWGFLIK